MTETEYWNRHLRKLLVPRVAYVWKISANYTAGVPDWWASGSKQDLWVENKRIERDAVLPPEELDLTNPAKYLTVAQQEWLKNRHNEGRNVGVVVFSKAGHVWFPDLTWQTPITREEFIDRTQNKQALAEQLIEILGENPS